MQRDCHFALELTAGLFEDIMVNHVDCAKARLKGNIRIVGDMRILIQHADREQRIIAAHEGWSLGGA